MVKHICGGGLDVNLIKLNGQLELRFAADATHIIHHTIHGADADDTVQNAREAPYGLPVMSLGLEMYLEEVKGVLELTFHGSVGSTLAFKYDGRQAGDPLGPGDIVMGPEDGKAPPLLHGSNGAHKMIGSTTASSHPHEQAGAVRNATRDAKVQTPNPSTRNAKTQSLAPLVIHTGVQTRVRRTVSIGVQAHTKAPSEGSKARSFPEVIDLTVPSNAVTNKTRKRRGSTISGEEAHTFTAAVATVVLWPGYKVFQSFNEPRDPYRVKRQAEPAADYRHIFIEGYRSEDDKGEEGRLHIDLIHHVLIWETYDDCETGARLTLDRLKLPRCEVGYRGLKHSHYFGDYQLHLYVPKKKKYIFSMDYSSIDGKVYGNNRGTGDERFHFMDSEKIQVVLAAIQDCLDHKLKYGSPAFG